LGATCAISPGSTDLRAMCPFPTRRSSDLRIRALDRKAHGDEIRRLRAAPDVVVGSVSAVTEDGTLVAVSASGSQLPAYAGGAGKVIWVVGAQKIVPDLAAAFRRIETYAFPLEDVRARATYGRPSAINKLLVV